MNLHKIDSGHSLHTSSTVLLVYPIEMINVCCRSHALKEVNVADFHWWIQGQKFGGTG